MRPVALALAVLVVALAAGSARAQSPAETPRPSPPRGVLPPGAGTAPPRAQPAAPAETPTSTAPQTATVETRMANSMAPQNEPIPGEAVLGAPVYPGATFLGSFNAGQGQRYYLFGTDALFAQVVAFYRQAVKSRGSEVYDVPPVWTFDIGRFREETMAYPPSVVVRDHLAGGNRGYLHVSGTESQRFATVIQIVPPSLADRR